MTDEAEVWKTAQTVCTSKELEALDYHYRRNMSYRSIALALDISHATVRDRIKNAQRKIAAAMRKAN